MLKLIEDILIGWTEMSRRLGWALVALIAAATVAAGFYAAGNLKVNTDTTAMLDQSLDFQVRARELRDAFPDLKGDIAVIIRAPTIDEADAFAAALRTRALARPDLFTSVFAPAADPFFRANGLLYLGTDELEARLSQMTKASGLIETLVKAPTAGQLFSTLADNDELAERSELGRDTLERLYGELADVVEAGVRGDARPFSWMGAVAGGETPAGGHLRMVYVSPKLDYKRLQPAKPTITGLKGEIAEIGKDYNGRVEIFITGDPALRADELASVATGIGISFLLSFAAVGALLLICYRSVFLSLLTLATLIISIVFSAAFAAATVGQLNLVSVAFAVLLVGLGGEYAIHLILHIQQREAGESAIAASLKGSVREVGVGIVLSALSTALGFFALVPTAFDGISQLGVIAGAGVIIALVVSLTFIPAALGAVGGAGRIVRRAPSAGGRDGLKALSVPIAAFTVGLGAVSLFLLPQARFDADPMSLRDPASQSVVGFNLLFNDADTIPYRLTRIAPSEAEARATAEKAKTLPSVRSVRTLASFVPADQEEKLELIDYASGALVYALSAEEDKSASPSAIDGAARLKARLESAYQEGAPARRLAFALGAALASPASFDAIERNIFMFWPSLVGRLGDQFNAGEVTQASLPENITRRFLSKEGRWRVDVIPSGDMRDPRALKEFVRTLEAEFPDIAGGAIQNIKSGEVISAAMLQAAAIGFAIITLFLWALLRRIGEVLLMLFPLGLAAVLTTAAGVVFDIPFNYANVIVLPLLLGIGIDSGIHLVLRERHIRDGTVDDSPATPRAILFAALTTIASFASLMLSSHRGTASMGELLTIAIGLTLVCTLIVLPVAFRLFHKGRAA